MPFTFKELELPGLFLVEPKVFGDERGYFKEIFKASDFKKAGIREAFVQDNLSYSQKGVLRGLHFQHEPQAQGKLVTCLKGRIFDVAVDLRRGSPTFKKWVALELSEENHRLLYIPAGFAHGFQVLSEEALVAYKCTAEYAPELDAGIIWNDPELAIPWPIPEPILSPKDAALPPLAEARVNFVYGEGA